MRRPRLIADLVVSKGTGGLEGSLPRRAILVSMLGSHEWFYRVSVSKGITNEAMCARCSVCTNRKSAKAKYADSATRRTFPKWDASTKTR